MRAEIIAIGSELLGPDKLDTNSLYLTRRLAELGIDVTGKTVVGDDRHHLETAMAGALSRAELVITTGGLGPTRDDNTREAASAVTGRPLELNPQVLAFLEERYRDRGTSFLENNRSQAYVLAGGEPIGNGPGAAPGGFVELENGRFLVMLPGVPREMTYMVDHFLMARLAELAPGTTRHTVCVNLCGVPESVVDHRLADIDFTAAGIDYTILANMRRVQIILSGREGDMVRSFADRVRGAFPRAWYGDGDQYVEGYLLDRLRQTGTTLAVAESCTGGLVGKLLTDESGSSDSFTGGVVAYANHVKQNVLGVPARLLEAHGAVSGQVAGAMAQGVRQRLGATFGLGITGIAGPSSDGYKPVGLVYLAASCISGTVIRRHLFKGTREMIRLQAATRSLDLLRRAFLLPKPEVE